MTSFVPLMAADLNLSVRGFSLVYVGALTPVFYVASALLSTFVGNWADRGTHPGRLVALGIFILSVGLLGFYVSLVSLQGQALLAAVFLSALLMGFGSSFYHPLGGTIMRRSFTSRTRGRAMGVVGATGLIGSTIYPSLFVFGALAVGASGSLFLLAVIGFTCALAIWFGFKVVRFERESHNGGKHERPKASEALTRGVVTLTVITAVRSVSTTGVTAFLPTYIATLKGTGLSTALGLTLSVMYAGGIIGQLIFGLLIDRFDKRIVLGVGSAGSALSTIGYVWTGGAIEILFIALFGLFTFSNFPTLLTLASEYVPIGSSSLGNALVWGYGITGGSVVGPALVTAIVVNNYSELGFAFVVMAAMGLVGAFVTPLMPRPRKK